MAPASIGGPGSNGAGIFASIIVPPSPFPPEPEDDPVEIPPVPKLTLSNPVMSGSPFTPNIVSPRVEAAIKKEANKRLASKDARRWCMVHGRQVGTKRKGLNSSSAATTVGGDQCRYIR